MEDDIKISKIGYEAERLIELTQYPMVDFGINIVEQPGSSRHKPTIVSVTISLYFCLQYGVHSLLY
jgi:hypothetical protein